MASGVITSRQPQISSPAVFSESKTINVGDLRQFSYLYVVLAVAGNTHNRLDSKFIPVNAIDFSATNNNAVWLYYEGSGTSYTGRLFFNSPTQVGVSALTSGAQVLLYGAK